MEVLHLLFTQKLHVFTSLAKNKDRGEACTMCVGFRDHSHSLMEPSAD